MRVERILLTAATIGSFDGDPVAVWLVLVVSRLALVAWWPVRFATAAAGVHGGVKNTFLSAP